MRTATLGQPPGAAEIGIASTFDLLPGDLLRVGFPFGSRGWVVYGGMELFTVRSVDPETGGVRVVDESGREASFGGGSRDDLLARLAEVTSFTDVEIYRPRAFPPGPLEEASELGMPAGFLPVAVSTWAEVESGDWVLHGFGTGSRRLYQVSWADPDLVAFRVAASDFPDDPLGSLGYHAPADTLAANEYVFRKPVRAWDPPGWALIAAGAAGLLVVGLA